MLRNLQQALLLVVDEQDERDNRRRNEEPESWLQLAEGNARAYRMISRMIKGRRFLYADASHESAGTVLGTSEWTELTIECCKRTHLTTLTPGEIGMQSK